MSGLRQRTEAQQRGALQPTLRRHAHLNGSPPSSPPCPAPPPNAHFPAGGQVLVSECGDGRRDVSHLPIAGCLHVAARVRRGWAERRGAIESGPCPGPWPGPATSAKHIEQPAAQHPRGKEGQRTRPAASIEWVLVMVALMSADGVPLASAAAPTSATACSMVVSHTRAVLMGRSTVSAAALAAEQASSRRRRSPRGASPSRRLRRRILVQGKAAARTVGGGRQPGGTSTSGGCTSVLEAADTPASDRITARARTGRRGRPGQGGVSRTHLASCASVVALQAG